MEIASLTLSQIRTYEPSQNLWSERLSQSDQAPALGRSSFLCCGCVAVSRRQAGTSIFPLDKSDFYYPSGRTDHYTIIEFSMFEGRSIEAKKHMIRLLFERVQLLGISTQNLEITIFETPKHNWGFRGLPGDEHELNYQVEI